MTRILSRSAFAPMLAVAMMFAIALVPAWSHGSNPDDLDTHGNNPTIWVDVLFPGITVPMPYEVFQGFQIFGGQLTSPAGDCVETLREACPEGICCICVYGNHCSGSCQAADGSCQPCPECNGDAYEWMP